MPQVVTHPEYPAYLEKRIKRYERISNIAYDCLKDVEGVLRQLQYGADKVIFTRSNSGKAMSGDDLAAMYTEICGKMCQTAVSLGEALRLAQSAVSREDLICITGSFYLIGQAKERFQSNQALRTY